MIGCLLAVLDGVGDGLEACFECLAAGLCPDPAAPPAFSPITAQPQPEGD